MVMKKSGKRGITLGKERRRNGGPRSSWGRRRVVNRGQCRRRKSSNGAGRKQGKKKGEKKEGAGLNRGAQEFKTLSL